jgi:uncharacterized protein (DUF433 family)
MVATETCYEHVVLNEKGTAVIAGTSMKVEHIIIEHLQYGWSPEELCYQHPNLTLGQIHSALAYYWDHREEMDRQIEEDVEMVRKLRREVAPSPFIQRLKAKGQI